MSGDVQVTDVQSAEWWNLVARFREASQRVDQVLATLWSQEATARTNPALSSEFDVVMNRAQQLRASIADTLSRIDGAVSWVRDAGDWLKSAFGLQGLGIVPLVIGIGAITAALAAVTKFLTDAWSLSKRIEEQQRLEATGLTPQEAANVMERTTGSSAGRSFLVSLIPFAALALAGWYLVNKMQRK
jgi:hypothetical protein